MQHRHPLSSVVRAGRLLRSLIILLNRKTHPVGEVSGRTISAREGRQNNQATC